MRKTAYQRFEKKLLEGIVVGTYTLDLGNVIAGKDVRDHIKIYNVGKMKTSLSFDQNPQKSKGLRLS